MGVEDAQEDDVQEEALGLVLGLGQGPQIEVGSDDAAVVGAVPIGRRGRGDEVFQSGVVEDPAVAGRPPASATVSHPS